MKQGNVQVLSDESSSPKPTIKVLKEGHPDRRFGAIKRLGKDGCGY